MKTCISNEPLNELGHIRCPNCGGNIDEPRVYPERCHNDFHTVGKYVRQDNVLGKIIGTTSYNVARVALIVEDEKGGIHILKGIGGGRSTSSDIESLRR